MSLHRSLTASLAVVVSLAATSASFAQGAGSASAEDLAKQLANPVASLVSVPFQSNWEYQVGPEERTRFVMNFQPVMPFALNEDWNLIARVIVPVVSQPPLVAGGGTSFGMGDLVTSFFVSPARGSLIWGVGPVALLPVSADPTLGSERWGAGPTAVVLKQLGPVTVGTLANHLWSYGGNADRNPVNATFLQPFFSYSARSGYTFSLNAEATGNWEAPSGQRWTVPINVGVSKVTRLGARPISVQVGAGYYAERPQGAPRWKLRAALTLLFPR